MLGTFTKRLKEIMFKNDSVYASYKQSIDLGYQNLLVANASRYNRFKAGHPTGFLEAFANHYCDISLAIKNYRNNDANFLNEHVFGVDHCIEVMSLLKSFGEKGSCPYES